jgi:hypothetical protein
MVKIMDWTYQNQSDHAIIFHGYLWEPPKAEKPGTVRNTKYPIPDYVGLTLMQQGDIPDPVYFADDVVVPAGGGELTVSIPAPADGSVFIDLSVWCGIGDGAFLRFNGDSNNEISIDARAVIRRMKWEDCAALYFRNPTSGDVTIGISALKAEVGSLPVTIIPGGSGSSSSGGGSGTDHSHSNMADLNKITVPGAGRIATSGVEIHGVEATEETYSVTLTATHVTQKYVELPEDYATGYPVVVVYEYLPQQAGIDYALAENTAPTKDRISWAGLAMEATVKAGDHLSITYYKKA